jgi:hypothetical protein
MKEKNKIIILSVALIFMNNFAFAESSALDTLLKERSDLILEAEASSESLTRLNEEKKSLIDKLVDANKQYDDIMKTQTQKREIPPLVISTNEITKYFENKRFGRCKIAKGEYLGEYIIQKDKIKIRFAFLPKDSLLAPKLSLSKGEQNEEIFQIEQPGYDPNAVNLKGDIQAIIRFRMKTENNKIGEVIHAVFMGQRLNDEWFGQSSSYKLTNMTCVLGS